MLECSIFGKISDKYFKIQSVIDKSYKSTKILIIVF